MPQEENPFKGRSHCDYCHHTLGPLDLIPIVSFLYIGGKCRYCHRKLSWQYPIIEFLSGLLFIFIALYVWNSASAVDVENFLSHASNLKLLVSMLVIFSSLLVIFVADLKYQIIPDEMLLSMMVGILAYHGIEYFTLPYLFFVGLITFFILFTYL